MKKIIILSILLALSLFLFNCGGGAGSSSSPKGENKGEPTNVQLLPSQFIAQTNSVITLNARVLDGNGSPVNDIPVNFTNLSSVGVLSALSAKTNTAGIASVTIKSTTSGFSTVQAEINKGVSQVRDRKTVFFSSQSLTLIPFMDLDVDGNDANEVYNENNDVNLFQSETDNQVNIRATVYDRFGERVPLTAVTFDSDSSEVSYPLGKTVLTNNVGEAFVLVQVDPTISSLRKVLNITAEADNGAFNMVSLFLNPVTIQTIQVAANPSTVASGDTSAITALVLTNLGTPAPDGTTVQFSVDPKNSGSIEPIAQTTDGVAEAEFTAAEVTDNRVATIKSVVVGVASGEVDISITTGLQVVPASVTVASGTQTSFTISGGSPPYTTVSNNPIAVYDIAPGDGIWTGSSITAHIGCKPASAVTLTISDSAGAIKTATINITDTIIISPTTTSICENDNTCSAGTDRRTFTISSGVGPYTVTSGNPAIITGPGLLAAGDNNFEVNANNDSIVTDTTVTMTVTDICGVSNTANVLVVNKL